MDIYAKALTSAGVLVVVIFVAVFLRHMNVIKAEQAPFFQSWSPMSPCHP